MASRYANRRRRSVIASLGTVRMAAGVMKCLEKGGVAVRTEWIIAWSEDAAVHRGSASLPAAREALAKRASIVVELVTRRPCPSRRKVGVGIGM